MSVNIMTMQILVQRIYNNSVNDLSVFAKNLLVSSILIVLLLMIGVKLVRFSRFYYGEYTAFKIKLIVSNNVHPAARQRKENVIHKFSANLWMFFYRDNLCGNWLDCYSIFFKNQAGGRR